MIESLGRIRTYKRSAGNLRLAIETELPVHEIGLGDSIAIDGCCLTVVEKNDHVLAFDAAEESLRRTSLGERKVGDAVHMERAMQIGDRLGGHIVQGHVDGVAHLRERRRDGDAVVLSFDLPPALTRYMVEKGGATFDGCNLTLTKVTDSSCELMLVPYTQTKTTFLERPLGAQINLEVDLLAKYVERLMQRGKL